MTRPYHNHILRFLQLCSDIAAALPGRATINTGSLSIILFDRMKTVDNVVRDVVMRTLTISGITMAYSIFSSRELDIKNQTGCSVSFVTLSIQVLLK